VIPARTTAFGSKKILR